MKPLPPTLRENRRYVLARIDPPWFEIDGRTLYETLSETVTALFGDTGMARIQPAVITTHPGYAIVRCIRSTEADLLAALAAVNHSGPQKIALRSVRTSGTLRALRRAIGRSADPPVMETGEARFQGKHMLASSTRSKRLIC